MGGSCGSLARHIVYNTKKAYNFLLMNIFYSFVHVTSVLHVRLNHTDFGGASTELNTLSTSYDDIYYAFALMCEFSWCLNNV